jgi:hypothetical protein
VRTISESVNVPTSVARDKGEGTSAGAPVIPSGQTEVIVTVTVAYAIE